MDTTAKTKEDSKTSEGRITPNLGLIAHFSTAVMIDPYRLQGNFSHKRHCESVLGRQITRHRSTLASDHADTDSQVRRAALDQSQGGLLAVSLSGTMSYTSMCTLTWSGKRGWISSTRQSRGGYLHLIQSKETVIQYPVLQSICGLLIKWSFFRPADALTPNHVDTIKLNLLGEGYLCPVYL